MFDNGSSAPEDNLASDPVQAFAWLLVQYQDYCNGRQIWLDSRKVLAHAEHVLAGFRSNERRDTERSSNDDTEPVGQHVRVGDTGL